MIARELGIGNTKIKQALDDAGVVRRDRPRAVAAATVSIHPRRRPVREVDVPAGLGHRGAVIDPVPQPGETRR